MFVVIFKAKTRKLDDEYLRVAGRMREIALTEFGCIEFCSINEGDYEIALSYWSNQDQIRVWKIASEHIIAQELGREKWYESYEVQICEIKRKYCYPSQSS